MRGVYTAGVLRFFMDVDIYFPYVLGVSIGACNAANYVARQPERNRIVNIRYVNDARFISHRRLLFKGELFGMDFIFDTIPHELVPFDFETCMRSPQRCITTATDCRSGEAIYYEKEALGKAFLKVLQAGCSLPLIQKPVEHDGRVLMDGGLADPVPIQKSIADGNKRHVLVLTQPKGYRKKRSRLTGLVRLVYRRYPRLCQTLNTRHVRYNETMDLIDRLEGEKNVLVIRPTQQIAVRRTERDKDRLYALYDQGYSDGQARYKELCSYLKADANSSPN